jgi:hypothetical protein
MPRRAAVLTSNPEPPARGHWVASGVVCSKTSYLQIQLQRFQYAPVHALCIREPREQSYHLFLDVVLQYSHLQSSYGFGYTENGGSSDSGWGIFRGIMSEIHAGSNNRWLTRYFIIQNSKIELP